MSFNYSADNYLKSSDHKIGDDLKYCNNYFHNHSFKNQLDIATGAGHFSNIFNSKKTVLLDLSFNMLKTASRNFHPDLSVLANSDNLPFKDKSFDLITCRIAMHHFKNPKLFFEETARCLEKNEYFVLIDSIVDIEDALLNCIEIIRDNSHIRSYSISEILDFSNKKYRLENFNCFYKKHNFIEWASRLNNSKENIKKVSQMFLNLPNKIKKELKVEIKNNKIISYTDKKGLFIFRKI